MPFKKFENPGSAAHTKNQSLFFFAQNLLERSCQLKMAGSLGCGMLSYNWFCDLVMGQRAKPLGL